MSFLGYNKGETLEFNYKKACGISFRMVLQHLSNEKCPYTQ